MSERKRRPFISEESGEQMEEWVVTFADLMSLLFSFFVLLTTLSTSPKNCSDIARYLEENRPLYKDFELRNSKLECVITLPSDFLFQTGQDQVQPAALTRLKPLFTTIKGIKAHKDDLLVVEGHTDDVPIKTAKFPSNWELSSARATNVASFLREVGMNSSQLSIRAYADQRPRVAYKDEAGQPLKGRELQQVRQRNRRVEIYLIDQPKRIEDYGVLFR
ncbi:MAG: OmpA family protein [Candidatus Lambdaproteobacteria bacterium]|nr:OmpA family protein [Candidatus Lambdaproteobacteria bacterium]